MPFLAVVRPFEDVSDLLLAIRTMIAIGRLKPILNPKTSVPARKIPMEFERLVSIFEEELEVGFKSIKLIELRPFHNPTNIVGLCHIFKIQGAGGVWTDGVELYEFGDDLPVIGGINPSAELLPRSAEQWSQYWDNALRQSLSQQGWRQWLDVVARQASVAGPTRPLGSLFNCKDGELRAVGVNSVIFLILSEEE
ncbi:MAG: hypothetical protein M1816_000580 [Peltula sp. TS41687]|nr:MAG: hypothetical protein M1816_000580 [Peltula sp. TS41687]